MRFYRKLFFAVYSRYKAWNGDDSLPSAWACVILEVCHCLNLVTVLVIVADKNASLVGVFDKVKWALGLASIAYGIYFLTRSDEIEKEFEDEDVFEVARMWAWFVRYAFVSFVAVIVAFVWRWSIVHT